MASLDGNQQACVACGVPTYHDAKPCAAVIVLDPVGNVLLGKRAREPMLGLWDLPGGFCNPDETPEDCAVRELAEVCSVPKSGEDSAVVTRISRSQWHLTMMTGATSPP